VSMIYVTGGILLLTALTSGTGGQAKVHIQGDPLAIEKPRFVAERMAHLSIRRAAALQDSIRPMSQFGQSRPGRASSKSGYVRCGLRAEVSLARRVD
jgi:hypothetical protein